jgi:hypothetical protein
MSEPTRTTPLRLLRSPFNGEAWPVPPDMPTTMYDALVERGFVPIEPKKEKRDRG